MRLTADDPAIELLLAWGEGADGFTLATAFVTRGGRFAIGETAGCNAIVPFAALGVPRAEIVRWGDAPCIVPPPGAQAWVDDQPAPYGAIPLAPAGVVRASFRGFTLRARLVSLPTRRDVLGPPRLRVRPLRPIAASVAAHVLLLALFAHARVPPGKVERDALATRERLLAAAIEREVPPRPPPPRVAAQEASRKHASFDPPSAAVARLSPSSYAAAPPGAPRASSAQAGSVGTQDEARSFGMIALLEGLKVDPVKAKPWTDALASLGAKDAQARTMFGADPIGSWGAGGLTLSGVGQGGGGKGAGIELEGGLSRHATADMIDAQIKEMDPNGNGFPHVREELRGRGGPLVAHPDQLPSERVPRSVIDGVVRAYAGRFQACHGIGLRRNPRLAGKVNVAFVIGPSGQVTTARDAGGELDDEVVRRCVVKTFYSLTFPAPPRGGAQSVTYPIGLGPQTE